MAVDQTVGLTVGDTFEENLLDSFPDPVVVLDKDRLITRLNPAARELVGGNFVGRDLAMALRVPRVLEAADTALEGEKETFYEISFPTPVARYFSLLAVPLRGEVAGAMLVFRDITSNRAAEKIRAAFVSNVSHELRSPIASLVGFIETLQGVARDDPAARSRFLKLMQEEAGRMSRIIDDLLSLSRVEAEEHQRPDGDVDIAEVIRSTAEVISIRAEDRDMSVDLNIAPDLPKAIGARDEVVQIVENLVNNAIKYGAKGTVVTVSAAVVARIPDVGGPGVVISVHNLGDSIPPNDLPRLTERFYRVDKGRSRTMGGTGLGLAIVKHMVNRHRGRLTIESTPEAGTTFTVYVPSQRSAIDRLS